MPCIHVTSCSKIILFVYYSYTRPAKIGLVVLSTATSWCWCNKGSPVVMIRTSLKPLATNLLERGASVISNWYFSTTIQFSMSTAGPSNFEYVCVYFSTTTTFMQIIELLVQYIEVLTQSDASRRNAPTCSRT